MNHVGGIRGHAATTPEEIPARWMDAGGSRPNMKDRLTFGLSATLSREVREVPARPDLHVGGGEREDLTEIATVGTLEIAPAPAADGWLLRIAVEDEIGPRAPEGGMAGAAERPSDLRTFYHDFVRIGRGMRLLWERLVAG
jgi:hypothetical protein